MKLADIRVVQFRRGSRHLCVKGRHSDTEFIEFDFLMKKHVASSDYHQPLRETERGIPTSKKNDIISKLVPLMPAINRRFWHNIMASDTANDLIDENDEPQDANI